MRTSFLVIALAAMAACTQPVQKSVETSAAYPTAAAETPPPRRADTFVQSYDASVAGETARLRAAGLGPAFDALRPIVEAHLGDPANAQPDGGALRRIRVDSTTNLLLTYGYRAAHLADRVQAQLVVWAADFSRATNATDPAILAPTVLIASSDGVREAADGSRSLSYRVVEPLKNAPPAGRTLSFLLSGPRAAGDPPRPPQPGEEDLAAPGHVVLLLTPPRPGAEASASNGYSRLMPLRLDGQTVQPSYHSGLPETTLARLREALRGQVCAPGYVPVGTVRGQSIRC